MGKLALDHHPDLIIRHERDIEYVGNNALGSYADYGGLCRYGHPRKQASESGCNWPCVRYTISVHAAARGAHRSDLNDLFLLAGYAHFRHTDFVWSDIY